MPSRTGPCASCCLTPWARASTPLIGLQTLARSAPALVFLPGFALLLYVAFGRDVKGSKQRRLLSQELGAHAGPLLGMAYARRARLTRFRDSVARLFSPLL